MPTVTEIKKKESIMNNTFFLYNCKLLQILVSNCFLKNFKIGSDSCQITCDENVQTK